MTDSTPDKYLPSKGTIMLICSVARQYAAMKRRQKAVFYDKISIINKAQA